MKKAIGIFKNQKPHKMPHLDLNTTKKIININRNGFSSIEIQHCLREDYVMAIHHSINHLLQKFRYHGSILDLPCRKRQRKSMMKFIDELMEDNDEMTATDLKYRLVQKYPNLMYL